MCTSKCIAVTTSWITTFIVGIGLHIWSNRRKIRQSVEDEQD